MTCWPRIGEDMYEGSDRWCVHCKCGWSGTFAFKRMSKYGKYEWCWWNTEAEACEVYWQHITSVEKVDVPIPA